MSLLWVGPRDNTNYRNYITLTAIRPHLITLTTIRPHLITLTAIWAHLITLTAIRPHLITLMAIWAHLITLTAIRPHLITLTAIRPHMPMNEMSDSRHEKYGYQAHGVKWHGMVDGATGVDGWWRNRG